VQERNVFSGLQLVKNEREMVTEGARERHQWAPVEGGGSEGKGKAKTVLTTGSGFQNWGEHN